MDPTLDQFPSLQAIYLRPILILSYRLRRCLLGSLMIGSFTIFVVDGASSNNVQGNQPTRETIKLEACIYE